MAPGPWTRMGVDELNAPGRQAVQVGLEVGGAVRDVMQAGTAAPEEAAHGGFGTQRLENLQGSAEGDANALTFQDLGLGAGVTRKQFKDAAGVFQ